MITSFAEEPLSDKDGDTISEKREGWGAGGSIGLAPTNGAFLELPLKKHFKLQFITGGYNLDFSLFYYLNPHIVWSPIIGVGASVFLQNAELSNKLNIYIPTYKFDEINNVNYAIVPIQLYFGADYQNTQDFFLKWQISLGLAIDKNAVYKLGTFLGFVPNVTVHIGSRW